jgi:hypothetical protein
MSAPLTITSTRNPAIAFCAWQRITVRVTAHATTLGAANATTGISVMIVVATATGAALVMGLAAASVVTHGQGTRVAA